MRSFQLSCMIVALAACATEPASDDDLIPSGGDGKEDTGYYSNLAIEMDGSFDSVMTLDLSAMSTADADALETTLRGSRTQLALLIDEQIKLAKNQLQQKKVQLNLSKNDLVVHDIVRTPSSLAVSYTVTVESLANLDELAAEGIDPARLVNSAFDLAVAADPRDLYKRLGVSCSTDFEAAALDPADVN
jgi:hypothetical protein